MTATVHDLAGYGPITVTQDIRDTGVVAYRVTGRHLHGAFAFKPDIRDDQAVPDRIVITCGEGEHLLADKLTGLPIINAITMIGGAAAVDLDNPAWLSRIRLSLLQTAGAPDRPAKVVAAAHRYALAVIGLLAGLYRLLDRAALMQTAARHTAGNRLKRWVHHQILPCHRMLAEAHEELAAAYPLAVQLQALSPLALLDSPPGCACSGSLAHTHADTYVTADDDGDWLTCHLCHQTTVMIEPGDSLDSLLRIHAEHTCPS